jgi:hypothetical protein
MSKLISNPFECGYCNISENYRDDVCKHPKNTGTQCSGAVFPGRSERISKQKHCFGPLCPYSTDPRSQCEWFDPEGEMFTCLTIQQPACMCQGVNCGHFKQIKYNFTTGL